MLDVFSQENEPISLKSIVKSKKNIQNSFDSLLKNMSIKKFDQVTFFFILIYWILSSNIKESNKKLSIAGLEI